MKPYLIERSIKISKEGINESRALQGYKVIDFGPDIEKYIKNEYPEDISELYKEVRESCTTVFLGSDDQNGCKKIYFELKYPEHRAVVIRGDERRYKIYFQGRDSGGIYAFSSWETDSTFQKRIKPLAISRAVFAKVSEYEDELLTTCNNYNPSCLNDFGRFLKKINDAQVTWIASNPIDKEFAVYYII